MLSIGKTNSGGIAFTHVDSRGEHFVDKKPVTIAFSAVSADVFGSSIDHLARQLRTLPSEGVICDDGWRAEKT